MYKYIHTLCILITQTPNIHSRNKQIHVNVLMDSVEMPHVRIRGEQKKLKVIQLVCFRLRLHMSEWFRSAVILGVLFTILRNDFGNSSVRNHLCNDNTFSLHGKTVCKTPQTEVRQEFWFSFTKSALRKRRYYIVYIVKINYSGFFTYFLLELVLLWWVNQIIYKIIR